MKGRYKRYIAMLLSMVIITMAFITLSVSALTISDIPDDLHSNPRPLNLDGGYTNFVYMEYNFYSKSQGKTHYYKQYYSTKTGNLKIEFLLNGTSYGYSYAINGEYARAENWQIESEIKNYYTKYVFNSSGTKQYMTYSNLDTSEFHITKLMYGGNVTVIRDGQPIEQILPPPVNEWGNGKETPIFKPVLQMPFKEAETPEQEHPEQPFTSRANDIINQWQQYKYIMFHDVTTDNNYLYRLSKKSSICWAFLR